MDINRIPSLINLGSDPIALGGAKRIAGLIVNHDQTNWADCCAATLSALLNFSGIYVDYTEEVIDLAKYLETDRTWSQIAVGQPIQNGDVGVFIAANGADLHHIYLVIDATSQSSPVVADNQGSGSHPRPVAGGPMPGIIEGADATTYFLRAS
jgi:hypothetical protein